ncbi:hypothetical protein PVAP13_9NG454800 [Panicum virgatum]|uniref:Uncharacterized protein n=1 Tax=Panicum virgatum TaxID=38727 RepID=A0A8T0MVZ4_PANVG|nr:hypothetical protein PVAP13_9NG454800 [Panicum virgatum]
MVRNGAAQTRTENCRSSPALRSLCMVEIAPPGFPLLSARTGRDGTRHIPSLSLPISRPDLARRLCCALPLPPALPRSPHPPSESPKFSLSSSTPPRIESDTPRPARSADPGPESPKSPIGPDRSPSIPPDSSPAGEGVRLNRLIGREFGRSGCERRGDPRI